MAAANASLIVVEDGAEDIEWGRWGPGNESGGSQTDLGAGSGTE